MTHDQRVISLENDLRSLIGSSTALKGLSEKSHYEIVLEAMELIEVGARMRLDELEEEEEDG